ncbi:MAG: cell wall surface anchored protein [Candidatus Berkelbacteria bacterium Licking1014_7]|uniref:Cell wall surface anchored protein n=1 Tax=Candidatus Berkelbacteria bacterium Licking1014_7 TaxID=2017147 RepID=A0A554LKU6_9BACT|nr:MAG: cell wall surface anchored protein [Candidatus Berkelbacteria bacterium Licking1014_7]
MKPFIKKHHKLFIILTAILLVAGLVLTFVPKSVFATDYTISSNTTWANAADVPSSIGNLTVNSGVTLTVGGGVYDSGGFTITGTGTLTVNGTVTVNGEISGATGYGVTFNFATVNVASGGAIDGNGGGFGASAGPGAGISGGSACTGGGGYGGSGGNGLGSCTGLALGGGTYGTNDTAPTNLGSGGGVAGGGAIIITASGTTTVSGTISANGLNGAAGEAGGGSGGSAYITTGTIAGTGNITANGGNGVSYGGGGGGGRISIRYSSSNTFSFANAVTTAGTSVNGQSGSNGTVIFVDITNKDAYVYKTFEFSGARGVNADLTASSDGIYRFRNVTLGDVSNNATVLAKGSGVSPSGIGPTLNLSGSFSLYSGSTFSANGQGYAAETGPGAGMYNGSVCTGGGGYGGAGGAAGGSCAGVAIAGSVYGSAVTPTDLGSGASTAGGGAITINGSSGTVTINGNMTANGSNGSSSDGGGASGGSVYLTANTFAGAGSTITAIGGNGVSFGGGGGGGRIAVYYITANTFTGTRTVSGGTGNVAGGIGSNYLYAKAVSTPVSVDGVAVSGSTSSASVTPAFIITPTEAASNPMNVKIQIATDSGFTANVQTFDQSSSGTGWTNSNTTPYATGTSVTYTVQSALVAKTTYYWRTASKAPAGANAWGDWSTPTYSFLTNAKPQITSLTASQAATGEVNISYTLSDEDDATATISFQYWDGSAYQEATTTTGEGAKASGASPGNNHTGAWTAKTDYNNQYTTGMKIKVTANDGNVGGTNTAESTTFILDTKNPVISTFSINSGAAITNSQTVTLTLSATDDTALQMQFSNDNSTWSDYETYTTSKAWTLTANDGNKTVYLRLKDTKGNTATSSDTIIFDTTNPAVPTNLEVFDVSKTGGSGPYRHFVDWDTNPDGDFSSYTVQRKVDAGVYSDAATITSQTDSHYFDDGLVNTSTYYYKIKVTDLAANPTTSAETSNQPASLDITPPTITNVPSASSITTKTATITWTTNEVSNSIVDYGATNSYGSSAGNSAESITSHSVALKGLTPGATYYFRVKSRDSGGNEGTADNSGAGYTFATLSAPVISAVSAGTPGQTSATITWTTSTASDSLIEWGTTAAPDATWKTSGNRSESVTSHSVALTGLDQSTTYYFQVKSRDTDANQTTNNNSGAYFSFNTASDSTPPTITTGPTANNILNNSAVITWKTGEASTTQVSCSITSGFGFDLGTKSTLQSEKDYNHTVSLTDLTRNTTYYCLAESKDSSANSVRSDEISFTTTGDETAPVITLASVGSITETTAIVSWQTDEPATSQVFYGIAANNLNLSTTEDTQSNRTHRVSLTGLTAGKVYYAKVISKDSNNNQTILSYPDDNNLSFTTLTTPSVETPLSSDITLSTVSISWNSNVSANSFVEFGASADDLSISQGKPDDSQTEHTVVLSGLSAQTKYYYRVKSQDSYGNVAYSSVSDFTTEPLLIDITPPTIAGDSPQVSVEARSATITWLTDKVSNSIIRYGTFSALGSEIGKDDTVTSHSVTLSGLAPATTYYYEIRSKDTSGNIGILSNQTFTTKAEGAISDVEVNDISLNSAIVGWTTNVVTSSMFKYGKDKNITETLADQSVGSTTTHTIRLKDLAEDTKYYFKLSGLDEDSNAVESDLYQFSTLPQPKVTEIKLGEVLARTAVVSWKTNVPTTSLVSFGTTVPNQDQGSSDQLVNHSVTLQGLTPNTKYSYQIKSTDTYGNTAVSETYSLTTKSDVYPPQISKVKSEVSTIGSGEGARVQTIISWQTDEPASSQAFYGIGVASGDFSQKSQLDINLNQSHVVVLKNLDASTTYRFRVASSDEFNNQAQSADYTILTPEKEASTLQIIVKLLEDTFSFIPAILKK